MSNFNFENMTKEQKSQYAVVFSCLCLQDAGLELNEENLNSVIQNSGNEVEAYWPGLFLNALEGKDIKDMLQVSGGIQDQGQNQEQINQEGGSCDDCDSECEADVSMTGFFSD